MAEKTETNPQGRGRNPSTKVAPWGKDSSGRPYKQPHPLSGIRYLQRKPVTPMNVKKVAEILYTFTALKLADISYLLGFSDPNTTDRNQITRVYSLIRKLPIPPHRGKKGPPGDPFQHLHEENAALRKRIEHLETRLLAHGDGKKVKVDAILDRIKISIYDLAATGDLKELSAVMGPLLALEQRDERKDGKDQNKIVLEVLKEVRAIAGRMLPPGKDMEASHSDGEVPEVDE